MSKTALVGYPCQIAAVRYLQTYVSYIEKNYPGRAATWPRHYPPLGELQWVKDVTLLVGIFCQASTCHPALATVFDRSGIDVRRVRKVRVDGSELFCEIDGEMRTIPLEGDEAQKKAMPGCAICSDYSALLADISVADRAGPDGATSVVCRTPAGGEVVARALAAGILAEVDLPGAGERIRENEQKKAARSRKNVSGYRDTLPPAFYTDDDFNPESAIYDSLLQDFYLVKDLIKNHLCVMCGMCETACPLSSMTLDGRLPRFNNRCSDKICGICFSACPQNFILLGVEQHRLMRELGVLGPTAPDALIAVRPGAGGEVEPGDNPVLAALIGYCLDQGVVDGVSVLHQWNTGRITRQLAGIDCDLLVDHVQGARKG